MTTFDRIKQIAKQRGLNLKLVATKSGLSENAIYSWRNKNPRSESLQAVADVLGVSVDYLLGNTDNTMPVQKDPSKPLTDTQEFSLMAAHWGKDLNKLSEEDRQKVIKKTEGYVVGLIEALED